MNEMLLKHNLKSLRLPTMLAQYAKLSREAADTDQTYEDYLLRLCESEVAARAANTLAMRIKAAGFPAMKELESYDFTAVAGLSKHKILELSRGQWVAEKTNACFIGNAGTGKTHLAVALGVAACRAGRRVKFATAQTLVNQLEEAQKEYRLERLLKQMNKVDLLVIDELGYIGFSRSGAELLFQVFADRYERGSILITSNLPFGEWGQIFQGERMTAALLDRFTHRCCIFQMNGESYRFRESSKQAKEAKDPETK